MASGLKTGLLGEDVPRETYDQLKHSNGDVYVIVYYQNGEPQMRALNKQLWDQAASEMGAISRQCEHVKRQT